MFTSEEDIHYSLPFVPFSPKPYMQHFTHAIRMNGWWPRKNEAVGMCSSSGRLNWWCRELSLTIPNAFRLISECRSEEAIVPITANRNIVLGLWFEFNAVRTQIEFSSNSFRPLLQAINQTTAQKWNFCVRLAEAEMKVKRKYNYRND